jgi:hypothetical protein
MKCLLLLLALLPAAALAAPHDDDARDRPAAPFPSLPPLKPQDPDTPPSTGLKYVGLLLIRATETDVTQDAAVLKGQVTGRMFGSNGTSTSDQALSFIEERYIGFLDYRPELLDGRAALLSAFEVDFTFGDVSNTVQANSGGAFNGDTVNLQTKRLAAEVDLGAGLTLVAGLQPIADNPRNPAHAFPDELIHGGTHLAFWGSDAAGVSLYGRWSRRAMARLAYFDLYENDVNENDDVHLALLDGETGVAPGLDVGAHLWYLHDGSKGLGTPLGVGPGSKLAELNGAAPLALGPDHATADIVWAGVDAHYNLWLADGPFAASAFAVGNFGRFPVTKGADRAPTAPPFDATDGELLGYMADLELAWRWGRTNGDSVEVEGLYASGDDNPNDRTVSSPITGNDYGIPGSVLASHRTLLLFPDLRAVNRQASVVYDPANLGYGVMAGFVDAAWDVVPDRLNLKLGAAAAQAAAPPPGTPRYIGTELNAELMYRPYPFLWFGLHGAVVRLGKFLEHGRVDPHDVPQARPWTTYASLTWVQF